MSLKDRLQKVERQAKDKDAEPPWFIVKCDGQPELSEAEIERKRAEYKQRHPDWQTRTFNVIYPDG